MPHHRTNRNKCKVWKDETEYLIWFNEFCINEKKRITKMVSDKKRGRKPKGFHSLKIKNESIILNFN